MSQKQKIAILGAAESGIGTAVLAQKQGYTVFVSDFGLIKDNYKNVLKEYGIEWEENGHTLAEILTADVVMKSPGIADTTAVVKAIREKQIKIVSEIEFAAQYTDATLIGITGSNGKTTTTSLTYQVLKDANFNVGLAGNIGQSFAYQVATENYDYYVLEVSSFQLDDTHDFKPHIAVLVNITPDHLDRYDYKFENYIISKFKITKNQSEEDYFLYCADDEVIMNYIHQSKQEIKATQVPFSQEKKVEKGAYLTKNILTINLKKKESIMSINELGLKGKHNVYNSMAAAIVARAVDIKKENIRESLVHFESLEHRMEKVLKIGGVQFINDSKATNVNSTWYAMESIDQPIVWIAGGIDKGNDYEILKTLVRNKVHTVICLGKDNRNLHEAFSQNTGLMVNVQNMKEAVRLANHFANKGDAVLLSPACASFDLFENYEDRGNQFKQAVREL